MQRRDFLKTAALAGAGCAALPAFMNGCQQSTGETPGGQIYAVTGTIAASELGIALPHEHVMSIFGGPPVEIADLDAAAEAQ